MIKSGSDLQSIGILHHPKLPASRPLAQRIEDWLTARGIKAWQASNWDEADVTMHLADCSLLIVLGGDGSTLRAARMAAPHQIPIFGINMGRVGFLSEAQPNEWADKLARVLVNDYWIEKRLMMQAEHWQDGQITRIFDAVNDVVVGRGKQARVLRLHLYVDDDLVTTYVADALVIATPTGSTAYSMAAGGPLLPPRLQNFVVVPVAAHLSLNRPLVLHEEAEITIQVEMDHEANLTADGQTGIELENGDMIRIKKNEHQCYFIRFETPGYFYRRLLKRLGLKE